MSLVHNIIVSQLYIKVCFTEYDDCVAQGKEASSQAYRLDQNPYPAGSNQAKGWSDGHKIETKELCGK